MELVAVGVWSFLVSFGGGMVGLVLGNLRLPLIVLVGSNPAAAAGANVAISALAATSSSVAHARAGRTNWRLFALMAPASVFGAVLGGLISGVAPDRILLAAIAMVVLYGAYEVSQHEPAKKPADGSEPPKPDLGRVIFEAVVIGLVVGLLGGIVGLILGSLRLPAMVRYLGLSAHDAVGTNAAVGVTVGVGGLIGHLPSGVDWNLIAVAGIPAMAGAYLGSRFTGRLDESQLLRGIAAVMVVSGLAMAVEAAVG